MLQRSEPPAAVASTDPPAAEPTADGCIKRWTRHLGPAGPTAAVMVCLPAVGGIVLLGFLRHLGPWLKAHDSPAAVLLSAVAIAGLCGFSLVPTYMLEIVAGWSFGAVGGTIAAVGGITAAATIGYGLSRLIVREHVVREMHDNPRCEAVRTAMLDSGPLRAALIVALLRLAPVVPFGGTNLLMASAGCRLVPFAVGTGLGILPRTAAVVFLASEMSELNFRQHPGVLVASVVATIVVVAILGLLARRALAQVTRGVQ